MSSPELHVQDLVGRYFRQRRELYGEDLYLADMTVLAPPDAIAETPESLKAFQDSMADCSRCALAQSRTHLVFGAGKPNASLMLVGEAPGREEDRQGEPFVGQAGQLLNKILAAIGFEREEVYVANILKCRPPENRDPKPDEIQACLPHLKKQMDVIQPKVILALGRIAAHTLLDSSDSLQRLRARLHTFQDIPLFVTYHPAALLRNPDYKRDVWEDVKKLRHFYDERVGDKPAWQPPKK